jgi:hypothetical protein
MKRKSIVLEEVRRRIDDEEDRAQMSSEIKLALAALRAHHGENAVGRVYPERWDTFEMGESKVKYIRLRRTIRIRADIPVRAS